MSDSTRLIFAAVALVIGAGGSYLFVWFIAESNGAMLRFRPNDPTYNSEAFKFIGIAAGCFALTIYGLIDLFRLLKKYSHILRLRGKK